MRTVNPKLPTGYIVVDAIGDIAKLDVDFLSLRRRIATSRMVHRARRAGKDVHVWTVNKEVEMARFLDRRIANIITDEPVLLRQVLAERAGLSDAERLVLAVRNWWW